MATIMPIFPAYPAFPVHPAGTRYQAIPDSVTVRTSSYTIPAGYSARVCFSVLGGSGTINGVTCINSTAWTVFASESSPLSYNFAGGASPYRLFTLESTSGASGAAFSFSSATAYTTATSDHFCPAGTVISGAGTFYATVELYLL